ncbi:MAG: hypothetical protein HY906_16850 [Deltaproteobacteria bacterium]|nr:hypothetical protein [Deltaproteobacteria bacterium]
MSVPGSHHEARPGLVTALCAALQGVGGGLGWSLLPPLIATIAAELSISHALGGLVWGAASLGIVVAAPVGGALVDRFGPRRGPGAHRARAPRHPAAGEGAPGDRAVGPGPGGPAGGSDRRCFGCGMMAPAIP